MTERRWKDEKHAEPRISQLRQKCFSEIRSRQRSPEEESAPIIHATTSRIMNTFGASALRSSSGSLPAERFP